MKEKKFIILVLLFLLMVGILQSILYSPLTPKAASIAHFKINSKLIPRYRAEVSSTNPTSVSLSESDIKQKYGRIELIRLMNDTILRGAVIEQGADFIRVETTSGIRKIPTDTIDTVEIIR